MRKPVLVLVSLCAIFVFARVASAGIINGSFETPAVTAGTFQLFSTGSSAITGWTVVGPEATNVGVTSGTFSQAQILFPAQDGTQWLDLTGTSNQIEGITQTVATTQGIAYRLSFYVGNVSGSIFGTTSTVGVKIDGVSIGSFMNSTGGTPQNWQQFTYDFTAAGASTAIEFDNLDPFPDNSNGLDAVTLDVAPTGIPEPATVVLIGCGAVVLLVVRRWRR